MALGAILSLVACQTPPPSPPATAPADGRSEAPRSTPAPAARGAQAGGKEVHLPAPLSPRSWAEARQQAARRLVAANPEATYMDKPPALLLAIPVMTVELNGDGSVRQISVMRYPSQARDTVKLAMAAIHRAAPYGDVSRLPKPWRFNETFLFKDDRKFKPMTLDQP
ncbi:MAG: hypothetical protein IIA02_07905 [Proteobacteria bacterium]|nr:hypothetical protein [Pseudomonadota bacterium]